MDPQGLANTAWAFATAGHAAPAFFEELTKQASEGRLREFKPLELANTAWACAKGNVSSPALFEAIADQMLGRAFLPFVCVCVCFSFFSFFRFFRFSSHSHPVFPHMSHSQSSLIYHRRFLPPFFFFSSPPRRLRAAEPRQHPLGVRHRSAASRQGVRRGRARNHLARCYPPP